MSPKQKRASKGAQRPFSKMAASKKGPPRDFFKEYDLLFMLGNGSFGEVWVCREHASKRTFACKLMEKKVLMEGGKRGEGGGDKQLDLLREIAVMKLLRGTHDSVVQLHEVLEGELSVQLVMELCKGGDLFDLLCKHGRLPEPSARHVFRQLASALAHCHSKRILHRDIKPENILFTSSALPLYQSDVSSAQGLLSLHDVSVRLADFGLSLILKESGKASGFCGSRFYTAPEMVRGRCYGFPSDVWSMGVVLCVMLTSRLPFAGEDTDDTDGLKKAILSGQVGFDQPEWDGVSDQAIALVKRMLRLNPEKRPTASQVLAHPWLSREAPAADVSATLPSTALEDAHVEQEDADVEQGDADMADPEASHGEAGASHCSMESEGSGVSADHVGHPADTEASANGLEQGVTGGEPGSQGMQSTETKEESSPAHCNIAVTAPTRSSSSKGTEGGTESGQALHKHAAEMDRDSIVSESSLGGVGGISSVAADRPGRGFGISRQLSAGSSSKAATDVQAQTGEADPGLEGGCLSDLLLSAPQPRYQRTASARDDWCATLTRDDMDVTSAQHDVYASDADPIKRATSSSRAQGEALLKAAAAYMKQPGSPGHTAGRPGVGPLRFTRVQVDESEHEEGGDFRGTTSFAFLTPSEDSKFTHLWEGPGYTSPEDPPLTPSSTATAPAAQTRELHDGPRYGGGVAEDSPHRPNKIAHTRLGDENLMDPLWAEEGDAPGTPTADTPLTGPSSPGTAMPHSGPLYGEEGGGWRGDGESWGGGVAESEIEGGLYIVPKSGPIPGAWGNPHVLQQSSAGAGPSGPGRRARTGRGAGAGGTDGRGAKKGTKVGMGKKKQRVQAGEDAGAARGAAGSSLANARAVKRDTKSAPLGARTSGTPAVSNGGMAPLWWAMGSKRWAPHAGEAGAKAHKGTGKKGGKVYKVLVVNNMELEPILLEGEALKESEDRGERGAPRAEEETVGLGRSDELEDAFGNGAKSWQCKDAAKEGRAEEDVVLIVDDIGLEPVKVEGRKGGGKSKLTKDGSTKGSNAKGDTNGKSSKHGAHRTGKVKKSLGADEEEEVGEDKRSFTRSISDRPSGGKSQKAARNVGGIGGPQGDPETLQMKREKKRLKDPAASTRRRDRFAESEAARKVPAEEQDGESMNQIVSEYAQFKTPHSRNVRLQKHLSLERTGLPRDEWDEPQSIGSITASPALTSPSVSSMRSGARSPLHFPVTAKSMRMEQATPASSSTRPAAAGVSSLPRLKDGASDTSANPSVPDITSSAPPAIPPIASESDGRRVEEDEGKRGRRGEEGERKKGRRKGKAESVSSSVRALGHSALGQASSGEGPRPEILSLASLRGSDGSTEARGSGPAIPRLSSDSGSPVSGWPQGIAATAAPSSAGLTSSVLDSSKVAWAQNTPVKASVAASGGTETLTAHPSNPQAPLERRPSLNRPAKSSGSIPVLSAASNSSTISPGGGAAPRRLTSASQQSATSPASRLSSRKGTPGGPTPAHSRMHSLSGFFSRTSSGSSVPVLPGASLAADDAAGGETASPVRPSRFAFFQSVGSSSSFSHTGPELSPGDTAALPNKNLSGNVSRFSGPLYTRSAYFPRRGEDVDEFSHVPLGRHHGSSSGRGADSGAHLSPPMLRRRRSLSKRPSGDQDCTSPPSGARRALFSAGKDVGPSCRLSEDVGSASEQEKVAQSKGAGTRRDKLSVLRSIFSLADAPSAPKHDHILEARGTAVGQEDREIIGAGDGRQENASKARGVATNFAARSFGGSGSMETAPVGPVAVLLPSAGEVELRGGASGGPTVPSDESNGAPEAVHEQMSEQARRIALARAMARVRRSLRHPDGAHWDTGSHGEDPHFAADTPAAMGRAAVAMSQHTLSGSLLRKHSRAIGEGRVPPSAGAVHLDRAQGVNMGSSTTSAARLVDPALLLKEALEAAALEDVPDAPYTTESRSSAAVGQGGGVPSAVPQVPLPRAAKSAPERGKLHSKSMNASAGNKKKVQNGSVRVGSIAKTSQGQAQVKGKNSQVKDSSQVEGNLRHRKPQAKRAGPSLVGRDLDLDNAVSCFPAPASMLEPVPSQAAKKHDNVKQDVPNGGILRSRSITAAFFARFVS